MQARGPALGLDVDLFNAATGAELEPAFASIAARKMDALLTAADPFLNDLRLRSCGWPPISACPRSITPAISPRPEG